MSETIHVVPEELDKEISVLSTLVESTELTNKVTEAIEAVASSTGKTATVINEINAEFSEINTQMQLLFSRTVDFLSNTSTHFVEADEDVKDAIAQSFESQSDGGEE